MDKPSQKLWDSLVKGLTILKPYIAELDINPIPDCFPNGTPNYSSMCTVGIILNENAIEEDEIRELAKLGWIYDDPYITLYHPNPYVTDLGTKHVTSNVNDV